MKKEQLQVFTDLKWLKIWIDDLKERGKTKTEIDHNENIVNFKKDIRKRLKTYFPEQPEESERYIIWKAEDYEHFVDVYMVERDESETREDFLDWFWENRATTLRGYDYSPTGLLFTQSVDFAKQTLPNDQKVWRVHETMTRDV